MSVCPSQLVIVATPEVIHVLVLLDLRVACSMRPRRVSEAGRIDPEESKAKAIRSIELSSDERHVLAGLANGEVLQFGPLW